jgi:adenylate cyclase
MFRAWRILAHPLVAGTLICHLMLAVLGLLWFGGAMERLELMAYDLGLTWRAQRGVDRRIAVVGITETDLGRYGWPINDGLLVDLVTRLHAAGARVVAVDLFRDRPVAPGSERLPKIIAEDGDTIWVFRAGDRASGVPPPPGLKPVDRAVGFADMVPDSDGVIRRGLLYEDSGGEFFTSLGLQAALRFLKPAGIVAQPDPVQHRYLRLGHATYVPFESHDGPYVGADARGYQMLLGYPLGSSPFRQYSMQQVLDGEVPAAALTDRLVLLGAATESVKDYFYTPVRSVDGQSRTYGVVLHAIIAGQILSTALDGAPLTTVLGDPAELGWIWLWAIIGGVCGFFARSTPRLAAGLLGGLVLLAAIWYAALAHFLWIPVATPALGFAGSAALMTGYCSQREKNARELLMRLFAAQVAPAIAEELWRQRHTFLAGGRPRPQRLTATVIFSDIRDFTALAERLEPQPLMEWLSLYMEAMAVTVIEHHGVVDKFIGDAVMALFGAPIPRRNEAEIERDAVDAVRCCLGMERALRRLNDTLSARGLPLIRISIGVHTGPVVAGSIGSMERMEYTVVGDTVNIANRLEGQAKLLDDIELGDSPCRILVSDATWARLGGRFRGRPVGAVALRGKSETVHAYIVLGEAGAEAAVAATAKDAASAPGSAASPVQPRQRPA